MPSDHARRGRRHAPPLPFALALAGLLAVAGPAADAQPAPGPVSDDGTLAVPGFRLPFSSLASPEARAAFVESQRRPRGFFGDQSVSIAAIRQRTDENDILPNVARQKARYAVKVEEAQIGGVLTQVFTPQAGVSAKNAKRVLINLHGGAFMVGARTQSQAESIPIAAEGRIRVVSIDYRQGPEFRFPAASEDVAAVYRELLKTHKPADIGIFGCSAGGLLAAQAAAWFQKEHLPAPAALGVFCASTRDFSGGDSAYVTPWLGGVLPSPDPPRPRPYFAGADMTSPLVLPSNSPAVLARFPPTLFITGTRAGEMSGAVRSHVDLVKAGVDARLFIWDGVGHGFFNNPDLPESKEAYDITVKFFDEMMDLANAEARAGRRSRR